MKKREIGFGFIVHRNQRYDTVGDYEVYPEKVMFRVSKMKDFRYSFLVLLHEMIEWGLAEQRGIKMKAIDDFDLAFKGSGEPGDNKAAPYHKEHVFATKVERMMAKELGVDWEAYDKAIQRLKWR